MLIIMLLLSVIKKIVNKLKLNIKNVSYMEYLMNDEAFSMKNNTKKKKKNCKTF